MRTLEEKRAYHLQYQYELRRKRGIKPIGTLSERFWEKVNKTKTCWEWTASVKGGGYGQFWNGKNLCSSHRFAYELIKGCIPKNMVLDHLCRNRRCVNPDHLEPVTSKENLMRGNTPSGRPRRSPYCKNGHDYNHENTWISKEGYKHCRICLRIFQQNKRDKERGERPKGLRVFRKTHCKNGHEFTIKNTHFRKGIHRQCRTCDREYKRKKRNIPAKNFRPYRIIHGPLPVKSVTSVYCK